MSLVAPGDSELVTSRAFPHKYNYTRRIISDTVISKYFKDFKFLILITIFSIFKYPCRDYKINNCIR